MSYSAIKPSTNDPRPSTPEILSFKIERDSGFAGYRVRFRWVSDVDPNQIIGFKIWKANSSRVMLDKKYEISQASLERLTSIKSFHTPNNVLFNKMFFSQNSKVTFFDSNSTRFDKPNETTEFSQLKFVEIDFIKEELDGLYEYKDRNVKFGETYYYSISLVTKNLEETQRAEPIQINIEDLEIPDAPKFSVEESATGALINIYTNTKAEDVTAFLVYKRREDEKHFEKVVRLSAEGNVVNFIDSKIIPGKKYFYKVYSVDFFENISYYSEEQSFIFGSIFSSKKGTQFPTLTITAESDSSTIEIKNLDDGIIGYRIERRDVWKFDKNFEIKTYNQIPWPSINFFNEENKIILVDRTVKSQRAYSYRITGIRKNGSLANFWVTPSLKISDDLSYSSKLAPENKDKNLLLKSFSINIIDERQSPIYSKVSWNFEGDWCYLALEIQQLVGRSNVEPPTEPEIYKADSIHDFIYLNNLKSGNNYIINMKVYDNNNQLLLQTTAAEEIRMSI